jgi:hypothetical protein
MKKLFLTLCILAGFVLVAVDAELIVTSETGTNVTVTSGLTNTIAAVSTAGKARAYLYITLMNTNCDVIVLNANKEPLTFLTGKGASLNLENFVRNQACYLISTNGAAGSSNLVIIAEGLGGKY